MKKSLNYGGENSSIGLLGKILSNLVNYQPYFFIDFESQCCKFVHDLMVHKIKD